MSIQSPIGTLDIKNATLRVGRLEVSNIQGVDTALNVTRANSILIYDDQSTTTTFTGFTSTTGIRNTSGGYIDVSQGYVYWGQKLPNSWTAEFEMDIRSGTNPGPLYANVFSSTNIGGDGYSFVFNDNNDKISLYYDGSLLTETILSGLFTAGEIWQKVIINYERNKIAISIDGSRKFYYSDTERETPYATGEYVNFSSTSSDGRKIRNIKFVNGDRWTYSGESNIVYTQGSVGIGVIDPQYTLDIAGNAHAHYFYGDGSNLTGVAASLWSTSGSDIYYNSGNVGIGTVGPATKLDVNGVIKNQNPSWNLYKINHTSDSGVIKYNTKKVPERNCTLNVNGNGDYYRVTITVAGRYYIGFVGFIDDNVSQGTDVSYEIQINGGSYTRNYHTQPYNGFQTMGGLGAIADLVVNDYIEINVSGNVHETLNASFYGFMIG